MNATVCGLMPQLWQGHRSFRQATNLLVAFTSFDRCNPNTQQPRGGIGRDGRDGGGIGTRGKGFN